jgi:D-alanyl-D-alanine carboxypeptidase
MRALTWAPSAFLAAFLVLFAPPGWAKYAAFVVDVTDGRVLHSVNADTRNYPASLTKMMTLYLVFEALDAGKISLDDRVDVSARAARQPASKLGLRRGERITFEQAIGALAIKSANDVATAVAETFAGSERAFALVMTAKARALGMSRTTFRNASGLPNRGQLSTAEDMATLAKALLDHFPHHFHYFSAPKFKFRGTAHTNHNTLLSAYAGTDGIKTGYIRASGFNLVASVKRGSHRLIGVVFGGQSASARNRHMITLLEKAFQRISAPPESTARPKSTARTSPTNASERVRKPSSDAKWGIQVGVYDTYDPAFKIAQKAYATAPDLLDEGAVKIVLLERRKGRPFYRARILGISKKDAYAACRVLKRKKIQCMELRMTGDVELALATRAR